MGAVEDYYGELLRDWESLEEFRKEFEWYIPEHFNAGAFLCDRWAEDKSKVACYYEDRTTGERGAYTFWELAELTNQFANYLESEGVEKGDRIGVNVSRKREALISYIAAWKAGVVPVPLSTLFGPDGLKYRLDDSGARLCIVDASNVEAYREATTDNDAIKKTLLVGDVEATGDGETPFWGAFKESSREYDVMETVAEDDLLLIYTSGTTGDPKGVRHAHRAVIGHLPGTMTNAFNLEIQDEETFWTPVEFSWAGTLTGIVSAWSFGVTLIAFESGESFDPERAFSIIDRYDVTTASIPPSGLRMMQQVDNPADRYDLDTVRLLVSGGEALGESIREWTNDTFDCPVHEAYGQTELWNLIAGDCAALFDPRPGSFGRPLPGHEMAIVDPETAGPLGPGEVGEIALSRDDPTVLKEFWNNPEKTAEKFAKGWSLTGDMGKRDEDGRFEFVGRKDDVIISSGYRIGPAEVEDAIAQREAVADAGVIGVPDEERGTVPKAFVVLHEGYEPTDELKTDLQDDVRDNLAAYEYPRYIDFIDELPRTSTEKVRRADLREREGVQ